MGIARVVRSIQIGLAGVALCSTLACSQIFESLESSRALTTDLISEKTWREPVFLDPNPDRPQFDLDSARAINGFDAARVSGSELWLVGSFYQRALGDASSGEFVGVARKYSAFSGWAEAGSADFPVLKQGVDLGEVTLGVSPSGSLLAAFTLDSLSTSLTTVFFDQREWKEAKTDASGLANSSRSWSLGSSYAAGSLLSVALDDRGRGMMVADQAILSSDTSFSLWSASHSDGVTHATKVTSSFLGQASNREEKPLLVNDRAGRVCVLGEFSLSGTDSLRAHCIETSLWVADSFGSGSSLSSSFSPTFSQTTGALLSSTETGGFAAVAGPAGEIMVVFYQEDELGNPNWVYTRILDGVAEEDGPFLIGSEGFPAPFVAVSSQIGQDNFLHTHAPAVTYLGEGKYLAVGEAIASESQLQSVFYTIFDPETLTWSDPEYLLDQDFEFSAEAPLPVEGVHLFSNEAGEAMVAIPWLSLAYDVDADGEIDATEYGRQVLAGRFSLSRGGWGSVDTFGRPGISYSLNNYTDYACVPAEKNAQSDPDTGDSQLPSCTLPPKGAVFEDGSAVLIYPMQDNEGVFRLAAVAFR